MRWAMSPTHKDFSPLFIGEITSTSRLAPGIDVRGEFQSPLHRGNHFNQSAESEGLDFGSISVPSSSGKSLQLPSHHKPPSKNTLFQSPLHRGNHFNV